MAEADFYIQGILERQSQVIRTIYDQYLPRITRFIVKNQGNEQDAQDIFQEAIMIIYANARKDGFALTCSFYTYLHAICRNLWLRHLKEKRKMSVTFSANWEYLNETEFEEAAREEEQFQLYWRHFKSLGKDCQRLLNLFFKGESMQTIMKVMGFGSEGYARKRKFQCKEKLMNLISRDPEFGSAKDHG